jgi:hypothetical protein
MLEKYFSEVFMHKKYDYVLDVLKGLGYVRVYELEISGHQQDDQLDFFKKDDKIYMMRSTWSRRWSFDEFICLSDCDPEKV